MSDCSFISNLNCGCKQHEQSMIQKLVTKIDEASVLERIYRLFHAKKDTFCASGTKNPVMDGLGFR